MDNIDITNFSIKGEGVKNPKEADDKLNSFVDKLLMDDMNASPEKFAKEFECSKLMSQYLARHGKEMEDRRSDIVRLEFEVCDDWDLKIKILKDALEKGITLEESSYYPDILEGVKEEGHFFR